MHVFICKLLKFTVFSLTIAIATTKFVNGQEGDLNKETQAVNLMVEASKIICETVPLQGSATEFELNGQAKAEVDGLLKKLGAAGLEGAAKYLKKEYSGLLQKDIATALRDTKWCRLNVVKYLKDKLLDDKKESAKTKDEIQAIKKRLDEIPIPPVQSDEGLPPPNLGGIKYEYPQPILKN